MYAKLPFPNLHHYWYKTLRGNANLYGNEECATVHISGTMNYNNYKYL